MYGSLNFLPHSNFAVFDHDISDISCNIACKELKIVQIAQLSNQLFQFLCLVHIQLFLETVAGRKKCARDNSEMYMINTLFLTL